MKVKLLKRLRKKAKKIRLCQISKRIYKITSPYSSKKFIYSGNLDLIKQTVLEERRKYILTYINRLRKEKKNYPILINI